MALNIEGKKCPICNSYLFSEDDVVFCPTCGAPHHRDCYNTVGHCGLEDKHGTEEQYDKKEAKTAQDKSEEDARNTGKEMPVICPHCKNELKQDMQVCPYCGRPRNARVFTFDALGGVNPATDLGQGVTAGEATRFVQVNTLRYIPKFLELKSRKVSWNWAAFLFPEGWFLSRKMYKIGSFFAAVIVAAEICLIPLSLILYETQFQTYNEIIPYILNNYSVFGKAPLILALIGVLITLATRIIAGLSGDNFYRNHVLSRVSELKSDDDREFKTQKQGGINLIAFLIGIVAASYLPQFISMFF